MKALIETSLRRLTSFLAGHSHPDVDVTIQLCDLPDSYMVATLAVFCNKAYRSQPSCLSTSQTMVLWYQRRSG